MDNDMIVCIPGPWDNREDFVKAVATVTEGEFLFAGMVLAHLETEDNVRGVLREPDGRMAEAFNHAGQSRLSDETMAEIARHRSIIFLFFPLDIPAQRQRLLKFTDALARCGGIAVKLENAGIAHEWEAWLSLLQSDNPFDHYRASVQLLYDEQYYYSCGMHQFGLPDVQVSNQVDHEAAAELMNHFNMYQIIESPRLESGHTFSLAGDSTHYRLQLQPDKRYPDTIPFHNSNGLWTLANA